MHLQPAQIIGTAILVSSAYGESAWLQEMNASPTWTANSGKSVNSAIAWLQRITVKTMMGAEGDFSAIQRATSVCFPAQQMRIANIGNTAPTAFRIMNACSKKAGATVIQIAKAESIVRNTIAAPPNALAMWTAMSGNTALSSQHTMNASWMKEGAKGIMIAKQANTAIRIAVDALPNATLMRTARIGNTAQ